VGVIDKKIDNKVDGVIDNNLDLPPRRIRKGRQYAQHYVNGQRFSSALLICLLALSTKASATPMQSRSHLYHSMTLLLYDSAFL